MSVCLITTDTVVPPTSPVYPLPPRVITDSDRSHQWMLKYWVADLRVTGVHLVSDCLLFSKGKRYLSSIKIW